MSTGGRAARSARTAAAKLPPFANESTEIVVVEDLHEIGDFAVQLAAERRAAKCNRRDACDASAASAGVAESRAAPASHKVTRHRPHTRAPDASKKLIVSGRLAERPTASS